MKIAVIGAGIAGVTSAWELAQDGHQVTVFDRRLAAAEEGSFAVTGLLSPGTALPWSGPGMPWRILRHLFARHAPARYGFPLHGQDLAWLWRAWRSCEPESFHQRAAAVVQLARYSGERLAGLTDELELPYDRSQGLLVLLRSERERQQMQASLDLLTEQGHPWKDVDAAQARALEPALNEDTPFHGAIQLADDGVGNCRQFALLLKTMLKENGVAFNFGIDVQGIDPTSSGVDLHLGPDGARQGFDGVVLCTGAHGAQTLRALNVRLPWAQIHGYSVSAHIREPLNAPRSAILDERYKIGIARLGQRVRVGGGAELGGRPERHNPHAIQTLYKVLHDWFPGAAVLSSGIQTWKGTRATLPDGLPLLGVSGLPRIWLNCGHGQSGWTLGAGAARALADLIGGRDPGLDLGAFSIQRFQR